MGDFIMARTKYELALLYFLAGLIYLFVVLRVSLNDEEVRAAEIEGRVGIVILVCVLAWPYSLFCWIFSWQIWLMPVSEVINRSLRMFLGRN